MLTIDFNKLRLKPGDRVLDLGCGEGRHSIGALFDEAGINMIAVDLNLNDLQTAKSRHVEFNEESARRCLYTQADGCKLPFLNDSFDHIICSEVLEHVPEYSNMLKEIERIIKPGGKLSISVPRYWPEKICWALSEAYHQVEGGHIRIFKSAELKSKVSNEGFIYIRKHWAHALHVPYWWLRCAFWKKGDSFFLTKLYHRLLIWDLMKRPLLTRALEALFNPLMGKSVVMYFEKPKG